MSLGKFKELFVRSKEPQLERHLEVDPRTLSHAECLGLQNELITEKEKLLSAISAIKSILKQRSGDNFVIDTTKKLTDIQDRLIIVSKKLDRVDKRIEKFK